MGGGCLGITVLTLINTFTNKKPETAYSQGCIHQLSQIFIFLYQYFVYITLIILLGNGACPPPLLSTSAIGYTLHQRKSLDTDLFLLLADSFDFENLYDRILLPFNYSQLKQDSFNGEFFSEKILLATSFRFVDRTALSQHRYIQYVFILCHTQM